LSFALLILAVDDCVFRTMASVTGLEVEPEDGPPLEKQAMSGINGRFRSWRHVGLNDKLSRSLVITALFTVV
jgi:hypothetical protein